MSVDSALGVTVLVASAGMNMSNLPNRLRRMMPQQVTSDDLDEWAAHIEILEDMQSKGHRLALELECLLLDTKDTAIQSKWWDSAHEALEEWRK